MHPAEISVIYSLPSAQALIEHVLGDYQIPTPGACLLLKRGLNDTYLVKAEDRRYILRVYRYSWRSKTEIDFELDLLRFLHECQAPIGYPIATISGDLTKAIAFPEGTRYTALFSYAPGKAVDKKLNREQSRRLGAAVATIHQATSNFKSNFSRPQLDNEYLLDRPINAIAALFPHRNDAIEYLHEQIEQIKTNLLALSLTKQLPFYGICIGDIHSGNTHFDTLNQPTLFDFDQCGYGWRAFDIGKFINTSITWQLESEIVDAFLTGYQDIRVLSDIEVAAIPIFTKVAHIWVMGIRASVVGDVLPYSLFSDEWLDNKLDLFRNLSN